MAEWGLHIGAETCTLSSRLILLLPLLNVQLTCSRGQCYARNTVLDLKRATNHFVSSWLHWTSSILERNGQDGTYLECEFLLLVPFALASPLRAQDVKSTDMGNHVTFFFNGLLVAKKYSQWWIYYGEIHRSYNIPNYSEVVSLIKCWNRSLKAELRY